MSYTVALYNKISPAGLDLLTDQGYTLTDQAEGADAILIRSTSLHDQPLPESVRCIARAGVGVNNIPVDECSERGVVVFNTPGANANAVKELVICGLLLSSRRVPEALRWASSLTADLPVAKLVEKEKARFIGPEIAGKTLGIIGLGAVGVMVANAAVALGMQVIGFDPYISVDAAWGLSSQARRAENLRQLFSASDYLSIHVPLSDSTRGMIDEACISQMKPGARLLNFARGELVDSAAVKSALAIGRLSAYVTDFPSSELVGADGVVMIPHLGASTPESEDNCARMAANELIDFLESGNISHSVNLPDVSLTLEAEHRLAVVNRNVPGMIGQLTAFLAAEGVNIENMINRSKKDYAYTLVDTNTPITEALMRHMQAIDSVLSVRAVR